MAPTTKVATTGRARRLLGTLGVTTMMAGGALTAVALDGAVSAETVWTPVGD